VRIGLGRQASGLEREAGIAAMKLIVQIPCLDEAHTLPGVLEAIPRSIEGIDAVELLIVDDGSSDGTAEAAQAHGADHVIRHKGNLGLASAFQTGLEHALAAGADLIVNMDGDHQYRGEQIPALVAPLLAGEADIVVGDRQVARNPNFSRGRKLLQRLGSAVVRRVSGVDVPDAVSGFRAMTRQAAERLFIVSSFSYTIDMLIQAREKSLAVTSVPITTNAPTRPSRLFSTPLRFIERSAWTMLRVYAMYRPLRAFSTAGLVLIVAGVIPVVRFLIFVLQGDSSGHIQSLVLAAMLFTAGFVCFVAGVLGDLVRFNRHLLERLMVRTGRWVDRETDANGGPSGPSALPVSQVARGEGSSFPERSR
jgi:glycosyltransferase involved in cell wall biosynthesis